MKRMGGTVSGLRVWSRWIVLSLVFLPGLRTAWGQIPSQLTINYIESTRGAGPSGNPVRAYVTVSAADGVPVAGLPPDAFSITEDGRPVAIDTVGRASDPMSVVLAIDTSGSMLARDTAGRQAMEMAREAAVEFVSLLSDRDSVAVYSFNRAPVLESDFTTRHQETVIALRRIHAPVKTPTCLYDTAVDAVKKAAEIPMGRRAVILLTDGRDEKSGGICSAYGVGDVIDAATNRTIRVPIFTIGVGPRVDTRELVRIARLTGGRSLMAESGSQLGAFYRLIADQLKNQYVVQFTTRSPSGEHSLVVKVGRQGRWFQDEKRYWLPPLPPVQPIDIAITAPAAGAAVDAGESVTVRFSLSPAIGVERVRLYVDNALKQEIVKPPFDAFSWDTAGTPPGLHVLRVDAADESGRYGSAEATLELTGPAGGAAGTGAGVSPAFPWVRVSILLLAAIAAGGGTMWWLLRRKKRGEPAASAAIPDDADLEEDTMFMADFGESAGAPPATLTVVESTAVPAGETYSFTARATVGRTGRNDINIPDKAVSRKHAEIYFEAGAYAIRDLGSKNGIRVDGRRVSLDGVPLGDGAVIRLGPRTTLRFLCRLPVPPAEDEDDRTRLR